MSEVTALLIERIAASLNNFCFHRSPGCWSLWIKYSVRLKLDNSLLTSVECFPQYNQMLVILIWMNLFWVLCMFSYKWWNSPCTCLLLLISGILQLRLCLYFSRYQIFREAFVNNKSMFQFYTRHVTMYILVSRGLFPLAIDVKLKGRGRQSPGDRFCTESPRTLHLLKLSQDRWVLPRWLGVCDHRLHPSRGGPVATELSGSRPGGR